MSKNIHSSDGIAEDLIRTITQLFCSEMHIKTLFDKSVADLEEGNIEVEKGLEACKLYEDMLEDTAQLRRKSMIRLYDMYKGNKEVWCLVKHLGGAMYTAFEVYQASDRDEDLFNLYVDTNKQFIKTISLFLGTEITECAACISDLIKAREEDLNKSKEEVIIND